MLCPLQWCGQLPGAGPCHDRIPDYIFAVSAGYWAPHADPSHWWVGYFILSSTFPSEDLESPLLVIVYCFLSVRGMLHAWGATCRDALKRMFIKLHAR